MKKLETSPFLIGRNYDVDYKAIVVPDYLSKVDGGNILTKATGDISFTEDNILFNRQVYSDKIEPFTIIFRVIKIKKSALNDSIGIAQEKPSIEINSNVFLEDEFGREIYLVEGFFLQSIDTEKFYIDIKSLEQLHNYLLDYFRNFWQGDLETKIIDSKININLNFDDYLTIRDLGVLDLRTKKEKFAQRKFNIITLIFIIFLLILQGFNFISKNKIIKCIYDDHNRSLIDKLKCF